MPTGKNRNSKSTASNSFNIHEAKLQLAASVFTNAMEGIFITDPHGFIIDTNETLTYITGYTSKELIGKSPSVMQSSMHEANFYAEIWKTLPEKNAWIGRVWNRLKNGEVYAEMLTIEVVRSQTGEIQNCIGRFTNMALINRHQQLEQIAHFDALTNLSNRIYLADRIQQAIIQSQRRTQSIAVISLDVNGIKAVNTLYGFDAGDQLITSLAKRIKDALRDDDTLARIQGGLFAVILVGLEQLSDWEPVLKRLMKAATDLVVVNGQMISDLSASAGVTVYPIDGGDAQQLLAHANTALKVARHEGASRYHLFDVVQDYTEWEE